MSNTATQEQTLEALSDAYDAYERNHGPERHHGALDQERRGYQVSPDLKRRWDSLAFHFRNDWNQILARFDLIEGEILPGDEDDTYYVDESARAALRRLENALVRTQVSGHGEWA